MDTEAIASEIVSIRSRLGELEGSLEGGEDEVADERASLMERLRHLQSLLVSNDPTDGPAEPERIHYLPPS